jgi:hypothetical protein
LLSCNGGPSRRRDVHRLSAAPASFHFLGGVRGTTT